MTPREPRPLGWSGPVRVLLAVVAGGLALVVLAKATPEVSPPPPVPDLVIDPNTAPPGVLLALPRLGPALVGRIVEAREKAPFASIRDLDDRVKGIGPATVEALKPYLRI